MGYYLPFRSILAHFVDYYSPFWGPGAIFMVAEPNVSLCVVHQHSPFCPINGLLLTVLADSGPLRGLLLTVLVSQSDFND